MNDTIIDVRTRSARRITSLDGLRGFAALAVVVTHLVTFSGLLPYAPMGIMGVVVFFALSGYLIGRILWRTDPSLSGYADFVRARMRRLLPALAALVLVGGAALLAVGAASGAEVVRQGVATMLQLTAFLEASETGVATVFRPTWSLSVEWTFYLLCPVAIFALRRLGVSAGRAAAVLGGGAVVLYVTALPLPAAAFYHLPLANLGVLAGGAALALAHARPRDEATSTDPAYARMAMLMLAILVVLPGDSLSWSWKLCVFPAAALSTLVVIHGCRRGGAVPRVLSARWIQAVGELAYSLYLWHVPVIWIVWEMTPGVNVLARVGLALSALVPLVAVSYHLLEVPVLSRHMVAAPRRQSTPSRITPTPARLV